MNERINEFIRMTNNVGGSNPINNLYPTNISPQEAESVIQNALSNQPKRSMITKQGLKTFAKYAPITGDIYDIGRGAYQASHGHPIAGLGQMGLGLAGLATLGGAGLVKSGGKAAIKYAVRNGIIDKAIAKDMLKGTAKTASKLGNVSNKIHNPAVQVGGAIVPEIFYNMNNNANSAEELQSVEPSKEMQSNGVVKPSDVPAEELPGLPGFNIPYTEEQLANLGLINNQNIPQANQVSGQVKGQQPSADNNKRVLDNESIDKYIEMLRSVNGPYIEALGRYLHNYPKNLDQSRRADLYFNGANLAYGLNPKAGEKFNTLQNQADIINTIKLIQDAKMGDINAINELQGNMAIANELELPPEAAFANKNLLTALSQEKKYATDLEKAKIVDAMRRFGYNTNLWRALLQQDLRNQGAIDVANIYAGSYNPGVGLAPGGTPVNQQTYSPLPQQQDAYAQAFAQFANK